MQAHKERQKGTGQGRADIPCRRKRVLRTHARANPYIQGTQIAPNRAACESRSGQGQGSWQTGRTVKGEGGAPTIIFVVAVSRQYARSRRESSNQYLAEVPAHRFRVHRRVRRAAAAHLPARGDVHALLPTLLPTKHDLVENGVGSPFLAVPTLPTPCDILTTYRHCDNDFLLNASGKGENTGVT